MPDARLAVEVFLRFGLLAFVAMNVLNNFITLTPTTQYSSSWLSTGSTLLAFSTVVVAAYGATVATRRTGATEESLLRNGAGGGF